MKWLAIVVALALDSLQISVSPKVVMSGGTVSVMCIVRPDKDNEWLDIVIEDFSGSGQQLLGEKAEVFHIMEFRGVPCEAGRVYCELTKNGDKHERRYATLLVAGCE